METVIDNKKMWEAMAKFAPNKESLLWVNMCVESQGLKLNDNFEIVSIEPEQFRPELGRWYYCFKSWHNREMYHNGGIYKAVINTHFDDVALLSDDGNSYPWDCKEVFEQYFRPATEEEILKAKYGITGIGSKKAEGKLGEMISQRMESAKAKEALLNDGELTEFEKGVKKWLGFNSTQPNDEDLKMIRKAAEELLSIARKQFVEEAVNTRC